MNTGKRKPETGKRGNPLKRAVCWLLGHVISLEAWDLLLSSPVNRPLEVVCPRCGKRTTLKPLSGA